MAIVVCRIAAMYEAELTPPHGGGIPWRSEGPMSRDELVAELQRQGCHQTDIGDAFYEADPEWLLRD